MRFAIGDLQKDRLQVSVLHKAGSKLSEVIGLVSIRVADIWKVSWADPLDKGNCLSDPYRHTRP